MKIHSYYIYILTNKSHTVLYTGVTNDLNRRVWEHKQKIKKGFTERYNVTELVHFELFDSIELAIAREKQIKGYSRTKKDALIQAFNPEWKHLHDGLKTSMP
jgi:putative endonuclease